MKLRIFRKLIVICFLLLITSFVFAQDTYTKQDEDMGVNISLFYPLSMNKTEDVSTDINLSWIYGSVGSIHKVDLSGGISKVKYDVQGFESAGILNYVGGKAEGFQSAGVANYVEKSFKGFQSGGTINYVSKNFTGVQAGGILNYVGNSFSGVQTAGTVNLTSGESFEGIQTAGIVNLALGSFKGVQVAGTTNFIKDNLTGLQISVLNIAGDVNGSQIGVVNISKSIAGIPIGLINYAQEGKLHPIAWYSTAMQSNIGIKCAVNDYFYSILSGGYNNLTAEIKKSVSFGYYMGLHLPINIEGYYILGLDLDKLYFDGDLGYLWVDNEDLFELDDGYKNQNMMQTRIMMGYELWKGLSIFGGFGESFSVDHDQTIGDIEKEFIYMAGIQIF